MLRALKKKKHYKTKLSISKSMLRSDKTCYWKASRAIRKNNFNCANAVLKRTPQLFYVALW